MIKQRTMSRTGLKLSELCLGTAVEEVRVAREIVRTRVSPVELVLN